VAWFSFGENMRILLALAAIANKAFEGVITSKIAMN
jgi:hypothetical protein